MYASALSSSFPGLLSGVTSPFEPVPEPDELILGVLRKEAEGLKSCFISCDSFIAGSDFLDTILGGRGIVWRASRVDGFSSENGIGSPFE